MRLLLVADTYPPSRISGAVQMRDLAEELSRQGHDVLVLVPGQDIPGGWCLEVATGPTILRVAAPKTKDVGLVRRTLAEAVLPFALLFGLWRSSMMAPPRDGIVWYSPTIFLGPLVTVLRWRWRCPSYLVLRDLFPDWAVDAGVLRRGLIYRAFKAVERFQYRQADVIGVQTPSNVDIVLRDAPKASVVEVLHNWLSRSPARTAKVTHSALSAFERRKIFVYAGNMGVAQGLDGFVELADLLNWREDLAFLLIGRGTEQERLNKKVADKGLKNIRVEDQVPQTELSVLLDNCYAGIIALHPAHTTHNIPGKLLTYLHAGLPILARINPGNDLHSLIIEERIGESVIGNSLEELLEAVLLLADRSEDECLAIRRRGQELAMSLFSPSAAATQIVNRLSPRSSHLRR